MPAAFLPSPARGEWHLGPVPLRAYALCIVLGIIGAVWLTARRYRRAGGQPDLILDVAAWAVPFGLVGALLGGLVDVARHLDPTHPNVWSTALAWDGAIGVPGAIALGALGAYIACRRAGIRLGPVAGAAAPATAFGAAVAYLGGWFSQATYGRPSGLPWAVEIAPAHRLPGYENFATFEPVFGYETLWCVVSGFTVGWAARRFALIGERAFALQLALTFAGLCAAESLLAGSAPRLAGLRVDQWAEIVAVLGSVAYLYRTKHRHGPDVIAPPVPSGASEPAGTPSTSLLDATEGDAESTHFVTKQSSTS